LVKKLNQDVGKDMRQAFIEQAKYISDHHSDDSEDLKSQVKKSLHNAVVSSYAKHYLNVQDGYKNTNKQQIYKTASELLNEINGFDIQDAELKSNCSKIKAMYDQSEADLETCVTDELVECFIDCSLDAQKKAEIHLTNAIAYGVLVGLFAIGALACIGLGIGLMASGLGLLGLWVALGYLALAALALLPGLLLSDSLGSYLKGEMSKDLLCFAFL
jgi:hypothetical protein